MMSVVPEWGWNLLFFGMIAAVGYGIMAAVFGKK